MSNHSEYRAEHCIDSIILLADITKESSLAIKIVEKYFVVGLTRKRISRFAFCPLSASSESRIDALKKAEVALLNAARKCRDIINAESRGG